ncbi:hypothetical protein [Aureimonas sp. ME7]|uniref:hypothetical protein n=1 Tax=Aureimonas sp. ME7 TaxID=2744252 RepID=UPI0015F7157A|nr:hypothetical protein [Aureimonas sp. ME7]
MKRLLIAFATTAILSTGAYAQTSETTNPVPGTSEGENSTIPADAAGAVVTPGDAPVATTAEGTSSVPVPGNNSGIDSTMPADAASTVVVGSDAAPLPKEGAAPVPGTSAGAETAAPPAN